VALALAGGGDDLEVLAAGQVAVEARLLDDGADAGEGLGALLRHGRPSSVIEPESRRVRPSSMRISVVLPAPFGPR
jgi:hypothetical protein